MDNNTDADILVVDDQATMRRIIRVVLNKCGYNNIDEAEDGLDALHKASVKQYDCIITDWIMPKMVGPEMVIELRKRPEYESIPILMVSTEGAMPAVVEAFKSGVTDFIVKPFTVAVFKVKMDSLWKT
ncbi:MAG: response regulator [Spartobacteria bacterium]|nr:response regulator [Spartobacteria bacterium]